MVRAGSHSKMRPTTSLQTPHRQPMQQPSYEVTTFSLAGSIPRPGPLATILLLCAKPSAIFCRISRPSSRRCCWDLVSGDVFFFCAHRHPANPPTLHPLGDFFALDGYTTNVVGAVPGNVSSCASNSSHPYWPSCVMESQTTASGWLVGYAAGNSHHASWLKAVPSGLRMILNYLQQTYVGPAHKDIMLTEFGFAESYEENFTTLVDRRWDIQRVNYFDGYLNNLLAARVEDGVNITGALAWGVYDNFEWQNGLGTRFGLQTVNYTSLERFPQASLFTFVDFFKQHGL